MKQHKDRAIILSRVDYAERDRILTLLCADAGKVSVLAKGVRAQKSRLAGGIELLSESEVSFIEGRTSLMTLTSARLRYHFGEIVLDIRRMNQAFLHIKTINKIADEGGGQEYYEVLLQALRALNDATQAAQLIDIWFNLQVLQISGSAPNLVLDSEDEAFEFNHDAQEFVPSPRGVFTRNDLKVLRLCQSGLKPPRLSAALGSEDRLQQLVQMLLKTNATEL